MSESTECPSCKKKCKYFTPESDFISEFGACIECAEKLPGVRDYEVGMKKAVFLYDRTGYMAKPWLDAGYECWLFDGQHEPGITRDGNLVKVGMWFDAHKAQKHAKEITEMVGEGVEFVFGFPECTYLSCSGAGWLYHPDDKHLPVDERRPHPLHPNRKEKRADAVELAKMVEAVGNEFCCPWALENPMSQLSTLWRKGDYSFHPLEFGGWLGNDDVHPEYPDNIPARDAYKKTTWIWASDSFVFPPVNPVDCEKLNGSDFVMGRNDGLGGKSLKTKNIRSATPRGFAIAVFEANHG
ncbi:MAG: Dcm methylase [Plesiomonas shigelloides]